MGDALRYGEVPGVRVGDTFTSHKEMHAARAHRSTQGGRCRCTMIVRWYCPDHESQSSLRKRSKLAVFDGPP
jgi:hypothetical protein